ncbi:CRISPR-associated protein, Cse1 family [Nitrosomonas cryotolerans]|uniref:CRISPR-associated protein, Cse1 family n=1 Tax=Nitrosomonas cryotolerans ATCC 49181 TaxID=1131553 RepID=A0A1N6GVI6_9PROT|nr:type I-E CRISPR-associated protein Cse1/CasA [Nitrosomonas cryotolerans]SFP41521.1 CRISPR-associated protein, Cse1 family [Nitrosomonas cryotolerans]SIO11563.1 CRISPR-associated protein, Cse1 family [Nitrosomonas cryotolerans ATCC 49181]
MAVENRFNLIDEPWIPIVDAGRVSLKQLFSHSKYRALGGNSVQKIALTKFLLAVAQAAHTPEDDNDWTQIQSAGLADSCLQYLDRWHDRFYLYGTKPFLQMPVLDHLIRDEKPKSFGAGFYPDVLSDNNTVLTQYQIERKLSDAEKAIFIITMMNFAFGGKRVHKNIPPLTPNYQGKSISAKSAPSLGNYVGYLHSYLIGDSVQETIWLNLMTLEKIKETGIWENELGQPPWEEMPSGEDCEVARRLKKSYMGCLLAMSRFVFLKEGGIFYLEGIQYPSHKEGWIEPSISLSQKDDATRKVLWLDVEKKPWRELTALLSFLAVRNEADFDCQQIRLGFERIKRWEKPVGIWSGGLKVRGSSGDQSVKQNDDFIESYVVLPAPDLITGKESAWFGNLSVEMSQLDFLSKTVYGTTCNYFKSQGQENKAKVREQAQLASNLFWQLCEQFFQDLLEACDNANKTRRMRRIFKQSAYKAYDNYCAKDTARQLDAWVKNRPNLSHYYENLTRKPS